MRALWLTVTAALLGGAMLTACERPPQRSAGDSRGVTITKSGEAPPPKPAPVVGGKLAVMDQPLIAPPVPAPKPAPATEPAHEEQAVDPGSRADYDPRYDGDPDLHGAAPSRRDCRRAERNEDPFADSPACRRLLGETSPPPSDPGLVADCIEAARIGDAFADSGVCRRLLDR